MMNPSLDARDPGYHPNDSPPKYTSPYFAHLDQQSNENLRKSRQPRRLALNEGSGEDRVRRHRFGSKSGAMRLSATSCVHGGNDDVRIEGGALPEHRQGSCGYREGWATQASGVRSGATDPLPPQRLSPLRPLNGAQNATRRSRKEFEEGRNLSGVPQEMRSRENVDGDDSSATDGLDTLSLSRLFSYAFPDTHRLSETNSDSLGDDDCGMASTHPPRPTAEGANHRSGHHPFSSPRLLPTDGTVSVTADVKTLVGVKVRRPPSPQFPFMAENCSPDADTRPAISSTFRAPVEAQRQEIQGAGWGNKDHCEGGLDVYAALAPVMDKTGSPQRVNTPPMLEDAGFTSSEAVRTLSRTKKRKRRATRRDVAPRSRSWPRREDAVQHRLSSEVGHDADSPDGGYGGWLGWTHGLDHARGGWQRAKDDDAPPSAGDETCLFRVDDDLAAAEDWAASWRDQDLKTDEVAGKYIGENRGTETAPIERSTARDSKQDARDFCVEDEARSCGRDSVKRDSALAYDQDVLGGDGQAEAGFVSVELENVAGILDKFNVAR